MMLLDATFGSLIPNKGRTSTLSHLTSSYSAAPSGLKVVNLHLVYILGPTVVVIVPAIGVVSYT